MEAFPQQSYVWHPQNLQLEQTLPIAYCCLAANLLVFFRMVIIRFDDAESERRALGWLAGRFSFKTWTIWLTSYPVDVL